MINKQRVLIVDDEKFNRQMLSELLLPYYDVFLAKDGEQAIALANAEPQPDLILLDVVMPGMDGYEVLRRLRSDERTCNIAVMFVTGMSDEDDETKGLDMGAVDYVLKPFRSAVVRARVRNHMSYIWQRKQLELDAFIDGLTGIPNRRQFDQAVDTEWRRANRHGTPLSLAMVDVDYFKPYNDTYGHGAGDEALRQIAKAMSQALNRSSELVARYGGEEFVLLLPEVEPDEAVKIAERVRLAVAALGLPHEESSAAPFVTISIGGVSLIPSPHTPVAEMLTRADKQLYLAKQAGRNRVSWETVG
ncbi:MAG: diguanylate cyclase [Methylobacter sp.]|nr:diguanylate cyclase [Methylobacter sp.]MDP2098503.1 diguanylate cyclase [Methylobacter sp.]MDP2429522.1 diguanylate cyclase [Methylobacter sp.]MDP3056040.1 diguanylate cyclase [Methylobacter sp.]MDP3361884.1 diguanylate cyclase [Methylobacter sp.]